MGRGKIMPFEFATAARIVFGSGALQDMGKLAAGMGTRALADNIAGAIRGNEARIGKQAAGAIAPWHGLFVIGKDLEAAFDAVERMDTNAYILMMAHHLGGSNMLATEREALEAAVARFASE